MNQSKTMDQATEHEKQSSTRYWLHTFALLPVLLVITYIASSFVHGTTRTAVFLVAVPLTTLTFCVLNHARWWTRAIAVIGPIAMFMGCVQLFRRTFDPDSFFGPMPQLMELPGYLVTAAITLFTTSSVLFAFSSKGFIHKTRWAIVLVNLTAIGALGVFASTQKIAHTPSDLIALVIQLEQASDSTGYDQQTLSSILSACGREADAEAISGAVAEQTEGDQLTRPSKDIDLKKLKPLPWRDKIKEIAEQQQIVIIMEAHNSAKHRQWIEQALPILHAAGFHDYAGETIRQPAQAISLRGYPVALSGHYVRDPAFGNLLRMAIDLDFQLHAYESLVADYAEREFNQATNLAKLFKANPKLKLVVHVGYGHVYKTPTQWGPTMAAHLWQMTGIEPYCILQTWHGPQEHEARQLAELIDRSDNKPVMLAPPPDDLGGSQFRFPPAGVDAIVVHQPSEGGPADRTHCFPSSRKRLSATWQGDDWPVMVSGYKPDESPHAIALDQVLLRRGERKFVLWIPDSPYELRVWNQLGSLDSASVKVDDASAAQR